MTEQDYVRQQMSAIVTKTAQSIARQVARSKALDELIKSWGRKPK